MYCLPPLMGCQITHTPTVIHTYMHTQPFLLEVGVHLFLVICLHTAIVYPCGCWFVLTCIGIYIYRYICVLLPICQHLCTSFTAIAAAIFSLSILLFTSHFLASFGLARFCRYAANCSLDALSPRIAAGVCLFVGIECSGNGVE